jgi:preprotein translocase subunit SecG
VSGITCGRGFLDVETALNIVMIIVAIVLVLVILLQTKGSSFSGAFGGDTGSIYRTRRGIEKTLFQFTIGIAVLFVLLAIVSSLWL